jgi:hypothetical protein
MSQAQQVAELDAVERAIVEVAAGIAERATKEKWADKVWSQNLLSEIGRIGHSLGFYVCGCEQYGQGEWLYDHVWLKLENGKSGRILDVPLILESEWGNRRDIDEDFQKLLLGRSQHRVMIFQQRNVERLYPELIAQAQMFAGKQSGDRYLFLGLDWADKTFKPRLFVV